MSSVTSSGEQPERNDSPAADEAGGRTAFAQALAQELEGGEPVETGTEGASGKQGESRKQPVPKNLEGLAERLGIEVSELYSIAVPAGHGREPMTLGKLKDRYTEWAALEADRLAFSEERVQREAALTVQQQELRELLSFLPRESLKPELFQKAAARVAERNKQLDAQLPVLIPEWKDETKRTADQTAMTKMLEGYGLTAPEVKAIRDPRLVKFIRDAMQRAELVRKALEAVKKPARKPQQQQAPRGAPARQQQDQQQRPSLKPVSGREQFSAALRTEV